MKTGWAAPTHSGNTASYEIEKTLKIMVLTPFCVIEVHKLFPLIMSQETQDGSFQCWPHLDDKLHICICGEAGCDEGCVKSSTE